MALTRNGYCLSPYGVVRSVGFGQADRVAYAARKGDTPSIGSAVVGHGYQEILPTGQPGGKFTFPCFRVGARFDHGMSGGPVFDEAGSLCGIIAGSYGNVEGTPISYVTTLWPMFRTLISANRSGAYPRDVEYPAIDLVLGGQIHAIGLEQLDPRQFPGRELPRPLTEALAPDDDSRYCE